MTTQAGNAAGVESAFHMFVAFVTEIADQREILVQSRILAKVLNDARR